MNVLPHSDARNSCTAMVVLFGREYCPHKYDQGDLNGPSTFSVSAQRHASVIRIMMCAFRTTPYMYHI